MSLDPDLGQWLGPDELTAARRGLVVRVAVVGVGEWDLSRINDAHPGHVGLLLLDGVVAREVTLGASVCAELLGAGDIVRPWNVDERPGILETAVHWNVLAPVRIALLDRLVAARLSQYPGINAALIDRLSARSQRLAVMQAIAHLNRVQDRLEALLWHLAERWGRVSTDGVVVALALSHRALGQLVGAQRPTVSTALGSLARRGRVTRRTDGTWLLHHAAWPAEARAAVCVRQRRRLTPSHEAGSSPMAALIADAEPSPAPVAPVAVDDVWTAIEALYERSRGREESLEELRVEIAALRRHALAAAARTRFEPATVGAATTTSLR
ncbi:Crp/Fnr family transcriptional regulator [Solirubrobacter deserti]|uniref:Crp/Fnr family transcriptional regulator n=1 Tax=Solirubrobacter deserti TaxID=2282478 RepID=A0ABT4RDI7_9ACTN|nr:Crp/Fnr family transcriptional regulator [Solirubrobacter deserti]MDA0136602.1 Crp/Fnr family transcriptional regulator [Solirubrobacter deserti]